jgi:hypothetical protein
MVFNLTRKTSEQINHVSWGQYQILTSIQNLYIDLLYIFIGKYNNHQNTTLIHLQIDRTCHALFLESLSRAHYTTMPTITCFTSYNQGPLKLSFKRVFLMLQIFNSTFHPKINLSLLLLSHKSYNSYDSYSSCK